MLGSLCFHVSFIFKDGQTSLPVNCISTVQQMQCNKQEKRFQFAVFFFKSFLRFLSALKRNVYKNNIDCQCDVLTEVERVMESK